MEIIILVQAKSKRLIDEIAGLLMRFLKVPKKTTLELA
jgi:ribosomal protein S17E